MIGAISECMGVSTMELGVKGRVARVFGATGGLGRAIAESLAREDCRLALADVDEAGLANVRDAIEASKEPALAARSAADIPIGRYGRPEEYGSVVAFRLAFRRPT